MKNSNFYARGSLYFSLLIFISSLLMLLGYSFFRPNVDLKLNTMISEVRFFDKMGMELEKVSHSGSFRDIEIPKKAEVAKLSLDKISVPDHSGMALYLGSIHSPIALELDGEYKVLVGSLLTMTAPVDHNKLLKIDPTEVQRMILVVGVTKLTNRSFNFIEVSGFGSYTELLPRYLIEKFATNHAFLGLAFIFIIFFLMSLFCFSYGLELPGIVDLSFIWLGQAIVCLYFSRFLSFIPNYTDFLFFGASVYILATGFYFKFVLSVAKSKICRFIHVLIISLTFLAVAGLALTFYISGFGGFLEYYKLSLFMLFGFWVIVFCLLLAESVMTPNASRLKYICLITLIVGLGNLNDIARISNHAVFTNNISPFSYLLGSVFIFIIFIHKLKHKYKDAQDSLQLAAVAKTTQMLAHDVRKPFTLLQSTLDLIQAEQNPSVLKNIAETSMIDINAAISAVNGMIEDVMEVGQEAKMITEDVSSREIILSALSENLEYNDIDVKLDWKLENNNFLNIDSGKVLRVFSNVIGNALQAMGKGTLTISTSLARNGFSRITIHNTGSFIAEDARSQLFEAFYTSEKKGGTGLGLAIAKKITEAHGGEIGCNSSRETGTEFWFTLPVGGEENMCEDSLPISAGALRNQRRSESERSLGEKASFSDKSSELQQAYEKAIIDRGQPIRVLLADDEEIYKRSVKSKLNSSQELSSLITIVTVDSGERALKASVDGAFDVILMDVDFGKNGIDGFEVVRQLRQNGVKSDICICSNRGALEYGPKAYEAGAQSFLPKPMSRTQLLKILLSSVGGEISNAEEKEVTNTVKPLEGKKIVLVEDNTTFRSTWEKLTSAGSIISFETPEKFLSEYLMNESAFTDLDALVVDNNFGDLSTKSGFDLARIAKSLNLGCPVAMASGEDFSDDELRGLFDLQVPKNPTEGIKTLEKYLAEIPKIEEIKSVEGNDNRKQRHDTLNDIIELEILGTDLVDGRFSESTSNKILAMVEKFERQFSYSSLSEVRERTVRDPSTVAIWVNQLKIDFCSDTKFQS